MKREDIRLEGISEIADRLGLSRERVSQLADSRTNGFPDPIARLKMGKVYLASDVDEWVSTHRPHLNAPDAP